MCTTITYQLANIQTYVLTQIDCIFVPWTFLIATLYKDVKTSAFDNGSPNPRFPNSIVIAQSISKQMVDCTYQKSSQAHFKLI